jgi:leucyl aminopeptidase
MLLRESFREIQMQVHSVRSVAASSAEAVVVGMYSNRRRTPGLKPVTDALGSWLGDALDASGFEGTQGQTAVVPAPGLDGPSTAVIVGLGDEVDLEGLRQAAGAARRAIPRLGTIATTLHRIPIEGATRAVLEGMSLADYRFDTYRSEPDAHPELSVDLVGGGAGWKDDARRAGVIVDAVALARDLVNEPAAAKAPLDLAGRVSGPAADAGLDVEVWEGERLEAEGMAGLLGVGGGSHRPPCLLRLSYRPEGATAHLALVGKGIVFDSGGLSIKTAAFMEDMKSDMAGAAAIIAATIAIARLGLGVNVTAYAALAENLPGGSAQRPGDVLTIRNGKTIEVLNTDAEGRLVLADALALAAEAEPDLLVDLATLTGACKVALGPKIAGLFSGDDMARERVEAAASAAGERVWPMPLPADYRTLIDSRIADMKNTGTGRYGGAISAALLLKEFVGEVPWAHLDIAGPAFLDSAEHYLPKGGTGFGVRTLVELAADAAGSEPVS